MCWINGFELKICEVAAVICDGPICLPYEIGHVKTEKRNECPKLILIAFIKKYIFEYGGDVRPSIVFKNLKCVYDSTKLTIPGLEIWGIKEAMTGMHKHKCWWTANKNTSLGFLLAVLSHFGLLH